MTKQRQRNIQKYFDLSVLLPSISAGKTFPAGSVKNSLKHVDLKIMLTEEMPFNFIQQIAVHVDEGAAGFALQVEMIPAVCSFGYVLITGAFTVMENIFADLSLSRQFFKMPVDGSLPDTLFDILKMAYYAANRYMGALKGPYVIENTLPLPGAIICRTFTRHGPYRIMPDQCCQYENGNYFHIGWYKQTWNFSKTRVGAKLRPGGKAQYKESAAFSALVLPGENKTL
jgi:hypothetical protein